MKEKMNRAPLPHTVQGAVWRDKTGEPTALVNSALSPQEQAEAEKELACRMQMMREDLPFEDEALKALFEKARAVGAAVRLAMEEEEARADERRDHRRQTEKQELEEAEWKSGGTS